MLSHIRDNGTVWPLFAKFSRDGSGRANMAAEEDVEVNNIAGFQLLCNEPNTVRDSYLLPLAVPLGQTRSWCPQTWLWLAWPFSACLRAALGADRRCWRTPPAGWHQHPGRHRSNACPPGGSYPGAPETSWNERHSLTSYTTDEGGNSRWITGSINMNYCHNWDYYFENIVRSFNSTNWNLFITQKIPVVSGLNWHLWIPVLWHVTIMALIHCSLHAVTLTPAFYLQGKPSQSAVHLFDPLWQRLVW